MEYYLTENVGNEMFSNSSRPGYPASRIDNERCSKDNTMRSGSKNIFNIHFIYNNIYSSIFKYKSGSNANINLEL